MATTSVAFKSKAKPTSFVTRRNGSDRTSEPVVMTTAHYDKDKQTIRVICEDGNARECRVERLPNVGVGRALWKKIQELGATGKPVVFTAAGGFDSDRWFYTIDKV